MALTIGTATGSVLTLVRQFISDVVADYRNADTKLWLYADAGQRAILKKHPEAAYKDDDSSLAVLGPDELTAFSATGQALQIRDTYGEALAYYIAARVLEEDSEDIANQRLSEYYQGRFKDEM